MKVNLSGLRLSGTLIKSVFAAFSLLLILFISLYLLSHKEVSIELDGRVTSIVTRAQTVAELLDEADIKLSTHDQVSPPLRSHLGPDARISVVRALPVVVSVNGKERRLWTTARTVGTVIEKDLGVDLEADIRLKPEAMTKVASAQRIELLLLTRWIEKTQAEVPFAVERQDNPRLAKGRTAVKTAGKPGIKEAVVEHVRAGGIEIERNVREERVVAQPVSQVVSVGTMVARPVMASAPGAGISVSRSGRAITMLASAYASGSGGAGWRTATGTGVYKGIVAVDPRVIPLGTRMYIDGYGSAVAADTGGAIKGNRIDLGFSTYGEAIQFGRRSVVVHIQ